jgi:hypothetical protein
VKGQELLGKPPQLLVLLLLELDHLPLMIRECLAHPVGTILG